MAYNDAVGLAYMWFKYVAGNRWELKAMDPQRQPSDPKNSKFFQIFKIIFLNFLENTSDGEK